MLIQEFHNLIRLQDHAAAVSLIAKAKDLQYPTSLIEYMETKIKNCPNLAAENSLNAKLESE